MKDYLPLVQRPARYTGGEINSVKKDLSTVKLKFVLAFPDVYEIGMSHMGLQILYQILNMRPDIACERVYSPWPDMETLLREKEIVLSTLESEIPLKNSDIVGFSLQHELSYTNVLNILDLGGIPLYARERGDKDPLVIGGGPSTFNPEPVADFFDAFLVGDGEEAILEVADILIDANDENAGREEKLKRLSRIEGVYIPSYFDVSYNDDWTIKEIRPLFHGYEKVRKRTTPDLNKVPATTRPVVPFVQAIHNRLGFEIARGCTRGCRFCQAGIIYRPVRERDPDEILRIIEESLNNTGYDELSLLSLSTGDYSCIEELLVRLMEMLTERKVAVSLPSMRVGTLSPRLAEEIKKVRKTGFTLAPEAGTERLRRVINKGINERDLIETISNVFSLGWRTIKLYFMIGLPTERDEDISAIVKLAEEVNRSSRRKGPHHNVTASISTFIPKPHTPFQWESQIDIKRCRDRQSFLRKELKKRRFDFKWQDAEMSLLEGLFSRGDRRLASVIKRAFDKGCRFDAWGDQFKFDIWEGILKEEGVDIAFYLYRRRPRDEVFPWNHIDTGVNREFLWEEYGKAVGTTEGMIVEETPDCKVGICSTCGICDFKTIKNITFYKDVSGEGSKVFEPQEPCNISQRSKEQILKTKVHEPGVRHKETPVRIRLSFTKTGDMRFLSHLEMATVFIRAVNRVGLPIRYSRGFHPLPQITFSPPIPLGLESITEYVELMLDECMEIDDIIENLNGTLPDGLKVLLGKKIPLNLPSLSDTIKENEYIIFVDKAPAGLNIDLQKINYLIKELLIKKSLVIIQEREKKIRKIDIIPFLKNISFKKDQSSLHLTLRKVNGRSVKPHEIIASLLGISVREASLIPVLKVKTAP
ncbi:MAG: TIGR03960 family B12-binding radical SAM protein [Thermodesulfobacteriota bacterium]